MSEEYLFVLPTRNGIKVGPGSYNTYMLLPSHTQIMRTSIYFQDEGRAPCYELDEKREWLLL